MNESPEAALARYYDLDLADDPGDLELYLSLAEAYDGDVLELCAGSGRISVPLAAAGRRVTAVDIDPLMLERANDKWTSAQQAAAGGRLELITADVTEFRSDRRYGLVILALNSLLLLDGRDAQRRVLAAMAEHLAPDGRAVIDVWLPTPDDLGLYDGRSMLEWVRADESGVHVAKTTSARYDGATQRAEVTAFFDTWADGQPPRRVMRRDAISFIGASELVALTASAGLDVETMAGDHALGPFDGQSERVVLVCRSAAE
jgi:SAM-dependent methyltransferase